MTRDWLAIVAGPLAWFCAHIASWMLAPPAYERGSLVGIYLIDLVALAIAIAAGALALGRIRALRRTVPGDARTRRSWFLAASGLRLSALSILLVLGLALPMFLLAPGAEP